MKNKRIKRTDIPGFGCFTREVYSVLAFNQRYWMVRECDKFYFWEKIVNVFVGKSQFYYCFDSFA